MNYINELEELENILDLLVPEEVPSIFNDEECFLQFVETALQLMDNYIELNPGAVSEPDFLEDFKEEIQELFYAQWEEEIFYNQQVEEDIDELLDFVFELFFDTCYQGRSSLTSSLLNNKQEQEQYQDQDIKNVNLQKKIDYLKSKPQPTQRTKEWYEFRYNLITASNAYKAFESQSMINQLIYEKCLPLKTNDDSTVSTMVNINTTLHWGQKYEPLSVMIYEKMYNTKVADFGCIQHETYKFLGASPDGINVDPTSERFGRMLEIKNIVNREITGIPKKEYWVQMQLQMEVCDLDECDFLETKFTEYPDAQSFHATDSINNESMFKKGIILYFHTKELRPFYVYKPLELVGLEEIDAWEEQMVDLYESQMHKMIFIQHIYWKLEKLSCVHVLRNKKWFEDHIGQLEKVWKTIEEERVSGYQHRAPNKRQKGTEQTTKITNYLEQQGCLLDLNKINKITVTKLDETNTTNMTNTMNTTNTTNMTNEEKKRCESESYIKIIKIRTESMDETKANL